MQPIMLARAVHVLAFTDVALAIGAPVARELERAGLPTMLDTQPDAYIPVLPALRSFQRIERQEGIGDIGFLASQGNRFDRLSGDFVAVSLSAPTLHARIRQFSELAPLENTNCQVSMIREGGDVRIFCNLVGYPHLDGMQYSEWLQVIVLVEIVRKSTASTWCPSEITFQSRFSPCERAHERFPDTRFLFGQKNTSIKVPVSVMSRPLCEYKSPKGSHDKDPWRRGSPAKADLDFPGSLKLALRAYLRERYPDVNLAAEMANTSTRTLQRRLAELGLSYSNLVQQARIEVSMEMLKDPSVKSLDIAHAVGYDDPSHFARAFRRVTGVSPQEFRLKQGARPN